MKAYRKIGILLLSILVVIQFIQPTKNISEGFGRNDISDVYAIPQDLHQTLVKKCYDCHSNNTRYPWYFNIQPIGWWLAAHVHDGKAHLNFSEFRSYAPKKANHKLEELIEVMEDRSMPLKAYTMFHEHTELTAEDEVAVRTWLASLGVRGH
jgi:hypothetical protein